MATSTLSLYQVEFKPEDIPRVDDLEAYLASTSATLEPLVYERFQYLRHNSELSVKIHLSQDYVNDFPYNYAKITSSDITMYYYIGNAEQAAKETIRLQLVLDTVNSLTDPRNFTGLTEITREHRDRFLKNSWVDNYIYRNIDKESEGITADKIKYTDVTLSEVDGPEQSWYLIYKANPQDSTSPVKISLCADTALTVGTQSRGDSITYTADNFDVGTYYYFLDLDNQQGTLNLAQQSITYNCTLGTPIIKAQNSGQQNNVYRVNMVSAITPRGLVLYKDVTNTLKYTMIYDTLHVVSSSSDGTPVITLHSNIRPAVVGEILTNTGTIWTAIDSITFTQANFFRTSTVNYVDKNFLPEGIKAVVDNERGIYVGSQTTQITSTINDINRTDSTLVKIIKYPYCPIAHTYSSGVWNFGEDWTYDIGLMTYNKSNLPELGNELCTFVSCSDVGKALWPADISLQSPKDITNESKLYHSDFFTNKLVYDSFSYPVDLEHIDLTNATRGVMLSAGVEFKPTGTINSKFGFKLDFLSGMRYKTAEDFPVLLSTRNNEEPILNNEYVNYIKYGYEYDKKQNALEVEQMQRQAAINLAGSAISALGGYFGPLIGLKGVKQIEDTTQQLQSVVNDIHRLGGNTSWYNDVAGDLTNFQAKVDANMRKWQSTAFQRGTFGVNALQTGLSAINTIATIANVKEKQENALQAKLAALAAQATTISGTDDIDLMSWYSKNKLHQIQYRPEEYIRQQLFTLFDYTGYAHTAREVPDVDSRIWYNFIQCTPHIDREGIKKLQADWLADLIAKYQQGVSVFHKQTVNGVDTWNFNRQYENWETWIVEGA